MGDFNPAGIYELAQIAKLILATTKRGPRRERRPRNRATRFTGSRQNRF